MVLGGTGEPAARFIDCREIEDWCQVDARRLPVVNSCVGVETLNVTDGLFERPEAEFG